jgi:hypothetical protein
MCDYDNRSLAECPKSRSDPGIYFYSTDIRQFFHPQISRMTQNENQFKVQGATAPGVQSRVSISAGACRSRQRLERDPTLAQAFLQISYQLKNK